MCENLVRWCFAFSLSNELLFWLHCSLLVCDIQPYNKATRRRLVHPTFFLYLRFIFTEVALQVQFLQYYVSE
jgi:hypothetical protein